MNLFTDVDNRAQAWNTTVTSMDGAKDKVPGGFFSRGINRSYRHQLEYRPPIVARIG